MTIKSKYSVGDIVWIMQNNIPITREIKRLRMTCDYGDRIYINYSFNSTDNYTISENKVFSTKEDLINSL